MWKVYSTILKRMKLKKIPRTYYSQKDVEQMKLLPVLYELAQELQEVCNDIACKHNIDGGSLNTSENFALPLGIMIDNVNNKEYSDFLKVQCELYNKIGQLQRALYAGIQERVVNPLKSWAEADYERIVDEIGRLNEMKDEMDLANADFHSCTESKRIRMKFVAEQAQKNYETQMALAKADLNKLAVIEMEQLRCFKNFHELFFNFHKSMELLLIKYNADKV